GDAVLLAAAFDYGVGVGHGCLCRPGRVQSSESDLRRYLPRPPRRPLRRPREGPDSTFSFSSSLAPLVWAPLGSSTPGIEATAAARSTRSILTSLRSPTNGPPPVMLTM